MLLKPSFELLYLQDLVSWLQSLQGCRTSRLHCSNEYTDFVTTSKSDAHRALFLECDETGIWPVTSQIYSSEVSLVPHADCGRGGKSSAAIYLPDFKIYHDWRFPWFPSFPTGINLSHYCLLPQPFKFIPSSSCLMLHDLSLGTQFLNKQWTLKLKEKLNSVAEIHERTIPIEQLPLVGEVNANKQTTIST
jgi:hypothetical protein